MQHIRIDIDREIANEVLEDLTKCAKAARENAGYSGSHHDGGAGRMLESVDEIQRLLNGELPKWFMESYNKKLLTRDPEYKKYLELKEKFEE